MTAFQRRASLDFKTQYGLSFSSQDDEIIVDFFCGGGGAGTGLEMGLGRPVAVAKNHSAAATSMHIASSPPKAPQMFSTAIQGRYCLSGVGRVTAILPIMRSFYYLA